ncbi:MAG: hypothetical protein EXR99_13925 [Gemmataceae bacterium]|nr:hypothetical protein [Gemmataceae bacterium]
MNPFSFIQRKKKHWNFHKILQLEALESRTVLDGSLMGPVANPQLMVDPASFDSSRILVQFKPDVEVSQDVNLYGAKVIRSLELVEGLYEVQLPQNMTVGQALSLFQSDTRVAVAEANYRILMEKVPNDPKFSSLYGMNNSGQTSGLTDADIDAPEAWNIFTGTGQTIVAVIDSGVDYSHQDLASNMWRNPGEIAGDNQDNDGNGFIDDIFGADFFNNDGNPMDDNGHGTHVAGTIGAVGNNGIGVTGVNWKARIMALKFLDSNGSGSVSGAISALNYAVTKGAKISNNSWGGGGYSSLMAQAINNAKSAGHIFVAAAGNEGANNDSIANYPSNYNSDNVVAVAATGNSDTLASFSNYGRTTVDLAAPGVSIYSTLPGNSYGSLSGTSMATPHVSGALSLLWDKFPNLTYQQVVQKLLSSVDAVAGLSGKVATGGRLNLEKLLSTTTAPPSDLAGAKIISAEGIGLDAGFLTGFKVSFNEAIQASTFTASDVSVKSPSGQALTVSGITAVSGSNNTYLISLAAPPSAGGAYSLTAGPDILDLAGNKMNQDGDTLNGEATADQFQATFNRVSMSNYYFTQATALRLRDPGSVFSYITISNDITIADLNVQINVSHTWDSDLIVSLVSPAGQVATLVARRGGSGDNFIFTTFDDESTKTISSGAAPFTGSFRPETPLSVFDGKNAKGIWTLSVNDRASGDRGTLNNWVLNVVGRPVAPSTSTVGKKSVEGGLSPTAAEPITGAATSSLTRMATSTLNTVVASNLESPLAPASSRETVTETSSPDHIAQVVQDEIHAADLAFSSRDTGYGFQDWQTSSWEESSESDSVSPEEFADMAFTM